MEQLRKNLINRISNVADEGNKTDIDLINASIGTIYAKIVGKKVGENYWLASRAIFILGGSPCGKDSDSNSPCVWHVFNDSSILEKEF